MIDGKRTWNLAGRCPQIVVTAQYSWRLTLRSNPLLRTLKRLKHLPMAVRALPYAVPTWRPWKQLVVYLFVTAVLVELVRTAAWVIAKGFGR